MDDDLEAALKPDEVALLLRCSKSEVYAMAERGEIASFRIGRYVRIRRSAVRALLMGEDKPARIVKLKRAEV